MNQALFDILRELGVEESQARGVANQTTVAAQLERGFNRSLFRALIQTGVTPAVAAEAASEAAVVDVVGADGTMRTVVPRHTDAEIEALVLKTIDETYPRLSAEESKSAAAGAERAELRARVVELEKCCAEGKAQMEHVRRQIDSLIANNGGSGSSAPPSSG